MKRGLSLLSAIACLTTALMLIVRAGLPDRAASWAGQVLPGERAIAPEINAIAPPFQLSALDHHKVNLLDLRGSPVVLNFWATWCIPCAAEMPELESLYQQYRDRGLRVLGVNLGEEGDVIAEWAQRLDLSFDMLADEEQQVAALYQLRGVPSTYVIAPSGVIVQIFYGPITSSTLQAAIAPYVT